MPNNRIIVINHEARIHTIGGCSPLFPGANEIDAEEWDRAVKVDLVGTYYIPRKLLEPVEGSRSDKPLAALKSDSAIRVVGLAFSIDQLGRWAANEKRPDVTEAIRERRDWLRKEIEGGAKPKSADASADA